MGLTCRDVRPLVESLASGDVRASTDVAAHLDTCAACAQALALATRVDRILASVPDSPVPPAFTTTVLRHVRRDWWRSEQNLDLWFNVAVAGGLVLVAAGVWMLINLSGLTAVTFDASALLMSGARALGARMAPLLPVYGTATTILIAALGLWWWAERGWTG